uniref:ABC transporter permease n=1 Tax=Steinernema glaseri TaxID=37863 RepID=A0A1I8ABU3_9BILA
MLGALGVNQAWLFTGVFALGAFLAGLGGAVQLPRQPANLLLDLSVIGDAFVIVVVGGMGSIPGAYVAALIVAELKALCIALGTVTFFGVDFAFPKLTLVMVLVVLGVMAALPLMSDWFPYAPVLALDILVLALFSLSLHFMMGPGGMNSFGHAAYFGLGAYAAALLFKAAAL